MNKFYHMKKRQQISLVWKIKRKLRSIRPVCLIQTKRMKKQNHKLWVTKRIMEKVRTIKIKITRNPIKMSKERKNRSRICKKWKNLIRKGKMRKNQKNLGLNLSRRTLNQRIKIQKNQRMARKKTKKTRKMTEKMKKILQKRRKNLKMNWNQSKKTKHLKNLIKRIKENQIRIKRIWRILQSTYQNLKRVLSL